MNTVFRQPSTNHRQNQTENYMESRQIVFRQGDVCLIGIDSIPKDAKKQQAKGGKVILAFGEKTGHTHRFEFMDTSHNVKLYVAEGGARFIHVTKAAALLHEEHSTINVPPGKYLLPQQVEYRPQELIRVAD